MNFISKLFKKNVSEAEEAGKGSVEEFVSLIRVYYQAVMAVNLGITNLNMLADMALFKRMLKIPTQNNKLGVAEKSRHLRRCRSVGREGQGSGWPLHQELRKVRGQRARQGSGLRRPPAVS